MRITGLSRSRVYRLVSESKEQQSVDTNSAAALIKRIMALGADKAALAQVLGVDLQKLAALSRRRKPEPADLSLIRQLRAILRSLERRQS
jgi:hypothetical protein